ncbi:MAG TPA: GIY-YIG nuclease family protein [Gemmatimonadales bacterium]|jgi:putative endonuclease|nr:GIY-YIG nuclease family protein [Gemmatimonadales bacterium]
MVWIVYLARCGDGSLYTGITTDPERRLKQHNKGLGAAYTRSRLPVTLVYRELADSRSQALRRERAIKSLTRAAKEALALQSGWSALPPG